MFQQHHVQDYRAPSSVNVGSRSGTLANGMERLLHWGRISSCREPVCNIHFLMLRYSGKLSDGCRNYVKRHIKSQGHKRPSTPDSQSASLSLSPWVYWLCRCRWHWLETG